jgi:hypothetical protein
MTRIRTPDISRCDVTFCRRYTPCYSEAKDVITSKGLLLLYHSLWFAACALPVRTKGCYVLPPDQIRSSFCVGCDLAIDCDDTRTWNSEQLDDMWVVYHSALYLPNLNVKARRIPRREVSLLPDGRILKSERGSMYPGCKAQAPFCRLSRRVLGFFHTISLTARFSENNYGT